MSKQSRRNAIKSIGALAIAPFVEPVQAVGEPETFDQILVGGPADGWRRVGMPGSRFISIPIAGPIRLHAMWLPESGALRPSPIRAAKYLATSRFIDGARVFEFAGVE